MCDASGSDVAPELAHAESALGVFLPSLQAAAKASSGFLGDLRTGIAEILPEITTEIDPSESAKAAVVVLGSIARRESSAASDCDYFVLQQGAQPTTTRNLIAATERARTMDLLRGPGAQRVFGEVVVAANLYESIGLDTDSNRNMTQRLLLLIESESVWGDAREDVVNSILQRYCDDYVPPNHRPEERPKVPRFLLNDLIRLWRTMAVDFGTKRWQSGRDSTSLRLAKLRITRKILFAGPLATLLLIPHRTQELSQLKSYLSKWIVKPPLVQLASTIGCLSDQSLEHLGKILRSYDSFIGLVSDREVRELLGRPAKNQKRHNEVWTKCLSIGDVIQECLVALFNDDETFRHGFREYAVF